MISTRILKRLLDVNTLLLKPAARSIGSASLLASLAVCALIPGAGATTLMVRTWLSTVSS